MTWYTGNAPLKLEPPGFPGGNPLISTVGVVPGMILCGVLAAMVTVTTLLTRSAEEIASGPCEGLDKFTAVSVPDVPPGVTYAKCAPGSNAISGFVPVFKVASATGQ